MDKKEEDTGDISKEDMKTKEAANNVPDVDGETVLEGTVLSSGKQKHLKLTTKGLTLSPAVKTGKDEAFKLEWQHVIRAVKDPKATGERQHSAFVLHYMQCRSTHLLRARSLNLEDKDGHGEKWINAMTELIHKVPGRPKRVFVIVNPIGGSGKGRQVYQKTVGPLLELAEIHTTVVVTERSKHALEIGEKQDFSSYDGIVVVGGDGLYQEILQGLAVQTQQAAGVDYHNPDTAWAKPNIPIGIVPAGTGNGVTGWVNCCIDVETATLNIIGGKSLRVMALTVYSKGKFVSLSALCLGYGMFGDIIKRTEELRWMKKARYPYAMLAAFMKKKRTFNCELEYLIKDGHSSQENKSNPDGKAEEPVGATASASGWQKHVSKSQHYCGITTFSCETVDIGDKYQVNPCGSCIELLVDTGCSQFGFAKTLLKYLAGKKADSEINNLDHIHNVIGFRIKLIQDGKEDSANSNAVRRKELEHIIDIDGEVIILDEPEMEVRLQPGFVSLFSGANVPFSDVAK